MNEHISAPELPQSDHRIRQDTAEKPLPRFPLFPDDTRLLALTRALLAGQTVPLRFQLLYRALRISTSYRMADNVSKNPAKEKNVKIADFSDVKKVYADLGSVYDRTFREWFMSVMLNRGLFESTFSGNAQELMQFPADIALTDDDLKKAEGRLHDYLTAGRGTDRYPKVAVFGVPIAGDKEAIKQALAQAVDKMFESAPKTHGAKYSFKPRCHENVVEVALDALDERVKYSKITLPALFYKEYGKKAEYKKNLSPKERESRQYATKIMTRRLKAALRLAENAARGEFLVTHRIEKIHYQEFELTELSRISAEHAEMSHEFKKALWTMGLKDDAWRDYLGPNFKF
jgi:hypothetical protein